MLIGYLARRISYAVATLLVATAVVFAITDILPGDPAQVILGVNAADDTLAALREQMGLNEPLIFRYLSWISDLSRLDLGTSYTYSVPVSELVSERLWISLPLAVMALALSTLIAIPVGVLAASNRNGVIDVVAMAITQLGIAIPNFWFALLLVLLFALTFTIFPAGGFAGWDAGIFPALLSLTLPAVSLALPQASILARVMRSSLLDVHQEDYMRTARAKGLPPLSVLWRHGVRNALIPVLTIMGLQFSFLIAGTIIIENIFYLPGLGRLIFQAIAQRDLIVLQSVILMLVAAVIAVNLLVDIAYGFVDPRIRAGLHE
jgi:peptide/nickel transport system permease protein